MGRNWAITVGINQYDNLRALKYAQRDAESVRDFFGELGFEQVYFFAENAPLISASSGAPFSAEPTFGRLSNFLDRRFEQPFLTPSDNLWFFFAGHGRREQAQDYLMLKDSNPRNLERSALKLQDLAAQLRRSNAGNVILLLDACRDDGSGSRDGVGIGTKQQGVITFYSCAPNQLSYEIDELQAGAFTHELLRALNLRGEKGNCGTVERLAGELKIRVPVLVERHKGQQQDPLLALDPDSKRDAILLPQLVRESDVQALKNHAYRYQSRGNRELARELWIQVLAAAPADADAIEELERLAVSGSGRRFGSTAGQSSGNRSTGPIQLPSMNRRRLLQMGGLGLGGAGIAWGGKVWRDWQARSPVVIPSPSASPTVSPSPQPTLSESPTPEPAPSETPTAEPTPTETSGVVTLEDFGFKTVKLSDTGEIIEPRTLQGKLFTQVIEGDISLKMVRISAGKFMMGSPASEEGRFDAEGPQREVSIAEFLMAQTPITQAQWRAVAKLPKVKIDLKADPSHFKGDRLPVEQVSWDEAVEFCARLSRHTQLTYRLPSEAEWEYACRAGAQTPFHFGETLTTQVANYDGSYVYGKGPKGDYRQQTTDVETFPANAWGLYDMHGNVWEWCEDYWHDNYQNAPMNGSAWLTEKSNENRLLRGGSWGRNPRDCRSAFRNDRAPVTRNLNIGFRVLLGSART